MIVPMKTVTVVTIDAARSATIDALQKLGVLHVVRDPSHHDGADSLREQAQTLDRALIALDDDADPASGDPSEVDVDAALVAAGRVQELVDQRAQLADERERVGRDIQRLQDWGNPDPHRMQVLRDAGVALELYEVAEDDLATVLGEIPQAIRLTRGRKGPQRLLGVALDGNLPQGRVPVHMPDGTVVELTQQRDGLDERIAAIDAEFRALAGERSQLRAARERVASELEVARVASSFGADHVLSWITGYVPHDRVETLRAAASSEGWGIVVRDPGEDEPVPTEIRNPKPIAIIKPVFDLLGTVPGYRELDISFFFLLFFTVFFAMIIGDGGYGVILTVGTLFFMGRTVAAGKRPGQGSALMLVLSVATVIWGAITGNWFGYAPIAELPILRNFVIESISITNDQSTQLVQYMCFIIGTVHLSIAHIWNFIRGIQKAPRVAALAQLGWLSMVLGLYYLVLELVIDATQFPMPDFAPVMIAAGLGAVIVFGAQEKGVNFFVGIGKGFAGLITTVLDSISAFSDIISYIRLFAVGLASLAIAEAFNEMAAGIFTGMEGGAIAAIIAGLVLFLGHTLNLAMGALSVVVHGVRLNMLEFSGHLGMEWTGVEYTPFTSRYTTSS